MLFCEQGLSVRAMARLLNRSPSSVSRELKRNRDENGKYSANAADKAYHERRKACVRRRKLDDPKLKALVLERLLWYWSPEQISGRLKRMKSSKQISFQTIYRAIARGLLDVPKKCLRRAGRGPSPHADEKRGRIHDYKTIHERPKAADDRSEYGHYEGDTVRGALSKGAAATFVDRKSGYLVAIVMPDRKAKTLNKAMEEAFAGFPAELLQSFTMDHGNEFFAYQQIEAALGTKVYFADPYTPGQRGLNENTNGLLRQYYPKKCNFLKVTPQEFQAVVDALNNRPRKRLGFRTPAECFPLDRLLHST